jgi:hypothetical protein
MCVRDPFSRSVVRPRVSGNLDHSGSADDPRLGPAAGQRPAVHLLRRGATGAEPLAGARTTGCSGRQTILWGNSIRRSGTWRIRLSHSFIPGPERLAAIPTAYIGRGSGQKSPQPVLKASYRTTTRILAYAEPLLLAAIPTTRPVTPLRAC